MHTITYNIKNGLVFHGTPVTGKYTLVEMQKRHFHNLHGRYYMKQNRPVECAYTQAFPPSNCHYLLFDLDLFSLDASLLATSFPRYTRSRSPLSKPHNMKAIRICNYREYSGRYLIKPHEIFKLHNMQNIQYITAQRYQT